MDPSASSLPRFQPLGTRREKIFSDDKKAQRFDSAVQHLKQLLQNPHCHPRLCSVPALVQAIFDDRLNDPALENIRELIRPNHVFGFQDISATGTKLLAWLAITQDPKCIDSEGNLRVAYTKSIIRGWFANGNRLALDDSALVHMRIDRTAASGSHEHIIFGKNRLANLTHHRADEIFETLQANRQNAGLGQCALKLDLASIPVKTVDVEFNEVAIGDMNGNSLMLVHELVSLGFMEIVPGKENRWQALADKIRNNDINGFEDELPGVLALKSPEKKLVLLGDLLADRAFNDWFTLSVINYLHQQGQQFEIIFSNHDATFVEYYLANRDRAPHEKYAIHDKDFCHHTGQKQSLIKLDDLLNSDASLRPRFVAMAESYLSHVNVVSCSLDQENFYSHAVVNQTMLADMLLRAGIDENQQEDLGLQEKIRLINQHFHQQAFTSVTAYRDFWATPDPVNQQADGSDSNPFYFAIWNIGPFSDNYLFQGNTRHRYLSTDLPDGAKQVIHGHTESMAQRTEKEVLRENTYATLNNLSDSYAHYRKFKDWFDSSLNVLLRAEKNGATSEGLPRILTLLLAQASDAYAESENTELADKIEAFFMECETIPPSEVSWFNDYQGADPTNIVMAEKRRQNYVDPFRATYESIPKDDGTLKKISALYEQEKQQRTAALAVRLKLLIGDLSPAQASADHALSDEAAEDLVLRMLTHYTATWTQLNKQQETRARDTGSDDPCLALITHTARAELAAIKSLPLRDTMLAAEAGMTSYLSLDTAFGQRETDTQGTKPVFLS